MKSSKQIKIVSKSAFKWLQEVGKLRGTFILKLIVQTFTTVCLGLLLLISFFFSFFFASSVLAHH